MPGLWHWRRLPDRIRRLVVVALLAFVAAVCVGRAVDLVRHGWRPTAPGERQWIQWASGNPWERAVWRALPGAAELPSGSGIDPGIGRDLVVRVIAEGPVRADWVHVRAQYRWPALRVLAVEVVGQGRSGPRRDEIPAPEEIVVRVSAPAPEPLPAGDTGSPLPVLLGAVLLFAVFAHFGPRQGSGLGRLAEAMAAVALALFVWKIAQAPLWSWDHHAIWGLKARRLAAVGLHPGWLAPPAFPYSAPGYPLGWPLVSSLLALGGIPGSALFKLAHVLGGAGVVVLVRLAVLRSGADRAAAGTAAALVATSPLLWDTESLGLADLPLALVAVAALVPVLGATTRRPLLAGFLLGLLPWIKQEGWVLSASLLGTAMFLTGAWDRDRSPGARRRERRAPLLALSLPCGLLWLLQPLAHAPFTRPGTGFLAGDWTGRVLDRLPELPAILAALARDLLDPAWLGLWLLFPLALVAGALRSRWRTVMPGGVVLAQLGVYAFVYLATWLDPVAHIDSSFLRIAAALAPLAAVSAAMAVGSRRVPPPALSPPTRPSPGSSPGSLPP